MSRESIPCAYKELVESRVIDELCMISERCLTSHGKNTKTKAISQESGEDLSSLVYKMLVIEDNNTRFSTFKTPLAAWQVCISPKQHKGGYQLDPQSLDALGTNKAAVFRKDPQFFTPARCNTCNNLKEDKTELNSCTCVERESGAKDVKAKSSSFVLEQSSVNNSIQNGGRLDRNTDSPCTEFKFHHSKYTDYYIKSYREQITNVNIRRHVQWRLRENSINTVNKTPKKTSAVKSKTIPKSSFAFYRFRISNKKRTCDNGVLKVGPCPRNLPEQNQSKNSRKIVSTADVKKTEQRKETTFARNPEFQSKPQTRTENISTISGPDSEGKDNSTTLKTESNEGKLKKVQLKIDCSTESPRIVPKAGRANRSKTRTLGVYLKPSTQCNKSYSEISYERKVPRKPTFEEREFLRITTPKPITHCQQLSKTPSDFGESPEFSPDKSVEVSPMRSPAPSVSGTSIKSQVIAEILMKREPQVVFPKNSNFQACITPSNYSTSSVESHIRYRKDGTLDNIAQDLDEEKNYNENHIKRMPSKPSIPRIGPFISS